MMPASKVVPQLMHQENREKGDGERQAGEKRGWVAVQ